MIADGLTKALPKQRFKSFVNIIGMVDIKERLNEEKQLEDLREKVRARRKHTARPVLPKAPLVWKNATLQNLTLDEL